MAKVDVYSISGIKKGTMDLPKEMSGKVNTYLLAQAIRIYEDRFHLGLAKSKTRAEVAISTRKIYRQKGTGGARHGPRSAPIFVGGGVAHGPKGIKRVLTLPKKLRKSALNTALNLKVENGYLIVVDELASLSKTKVAYALIEKIIETLKDGKKNLKFTFVLTKENKSANLALRNIKNVEVTTFMNLNAYQVYFGGVIVFDKDALLSIGKSKDKLTKAETEEKTLKIQKKALKSKANFSKTKPKRETSRKRAVKKTNRLL